MSLTVGYAFACPSFVAETSRRASLNSFATMHVASSLLFLFCSLFSLLFTHWASTTQGAECLCVVRNNRGLYEESIFVLL